MFAPTIGGQPVDGRLGVRLRVLVFTRNLGCGHITPGDHERRVVVGVYLIPQGTPEVRQVREEDRRRNLVRAHPIPRIVCPNCARTNIARE